MFPENAWVVGLPGEPDDQPPARTDESHNLLWRWGAGNCVLDRGNRKLLKPSGRRVGMPIPGIVNPGRHPQTTRLLNLARNPSESDDLASEQPRLAQRLKKLYEKWSQEVAETIPAAKQ